MRRFYGHLQRSALFALVTILCSTAVWADVTGSILGIVRDSSQGIVVGANVVATNVETNFSKETKSDSAGQYRILALPTGKYKVTATAPGFQQFTTTDVELKVNDQLRVDVTFSVGSLQQSVSIEANTVQVNTESTQLGDVIETKKMVSLPLNGRSFLDLLGLQGGVVPISTGLIPGDRPVSGMIGNPGNVSINGQRETQNAFLVNGGDVSEGKDNGAGLIPNLDSIAEFRLISNSFDAEYGRFGGGVMNAITKSGTNGLHGAAFEYLRNDKMDARNFFDPSKAELRRNQFGYAIGGPLLKNKLFWFTDYQGTRQVTGASTGAVKLPTASQRQGIFSPSSFAGPTGAPMTVYGSYWASVLTQRLGYGVSDGERYSFAGCTSDCVFPGGVIPQRAFDKAAVAISPLIPLPNVNPAQGLYADAGQKAPVTDDKIGQRIDFINQKTGNWSFYYHWDDSTLTNPLEGSVPGFLGITPERAQMFTWSNTKTFGPSAVNEFRLHFFRTSIFTDKPGSTFAKLSDLGFATGGDLGIIPSGPAGYPQYVPPIIFNSFKIGVNWLSMNQPNNTYSVSDGFSKIAGRHSLKFGGEFRYLQINVRNVCAPNGQFTFSGVETGSDFADFLLGAPSLYVQCSLQVMDTRTRYGGLYAQDSWKVTPNFTVNLGLRYEVSMPWYDTQGRLNTIIPGVQSTIFPTAPKGWLVPGDPGVPSTITPTDWNNLAPRVGLAYSPNTSGGFLGKVLGGPGKTSIRAAFGQYFQAQENLGNFGVMGDAPYGQYWQSPLPTMFDTPFQTRSDGTSQGQRFPFVMPIPGAPGNKTLDWTQFLPLLGPGYSVNNVLPYALHYNFTVQRELSKSTVLTVAYVGTQAHHLMAQYPANPGSAAKCFALNAAGATPTCGPNGELRTYTLPSGEKVYGTTTAFPKEFSSVLQWNETVANSNYNALQVTAERKASDLTFLVSYTWSKSIDNASIQGDYMNHLNHRLTRALSAFDMAHNFVASYNWAIPFDRAFSSLPRRLTGGWNLSGITRLTTGLPVKINQGSGDIALLGRSGLDTPNIVAPVVIQDPRNAGPDGRLNTYFLKSSFVSENLGVIGNSNRRFFHGPGIVSTDFGMSKAIPVRESSSVQIRAEFFNIFNHANFNNPSGNFSSGTFGLVTSAKAPRIGQISARFVW